LTTQISYAVLKEDVKGIITGNHITYRNLQARYFSPIPISLSASFRLVL